MSCSERDSVQDATINVLGNDFSSLDLHVSHLRACTPVITTSGISKNNTFASVYPLPYALDRIVSPDTHDRDTSSSESLLCTMLLNVSSQNVTSNNVNPHAQFCDPELTCGSTLNPNAISFLPDMGSSANSRNNVSLFCYSGSPSIHDIRTPELTLVCRSLSRSLQQTLQNEALILNDTPTAHNIHTPNISQMHNFDDSSNDKYSLIISSHLSEERPSYIRDYSPYDALKKIRISFVDHLIIGQLNINSLRNKIEDLNHIVAGHIDILLITESKLDSAFPDNQFKIDGYYPPFRADRDKYGGGVIIYVRNDVPCKLLHNHTSTKFIEGIFLEINIRKFKWLLFGGYNPSKSNILNFFTELEPILDRHMTKYVNFIMLGDFNSEISENAMKEFCENYNLTNLIKEPTCFKNPTNPSSIDLILTNRPKSFKNNKIIETGLSDHHKLTLTVMRAHFQKKDPIINTYRDFKNFSENNFRKELLK